MDDDTRPLDRDDVRGILATAGTILGTSRRDPYVRTGWATTDERPRAAASVAR